MAGLGGLLYGVDVGIIAGALPYLEATSGLNAGQLSIVVAAVLLGSVISTLFAGLLADWMGRKSLMALSGVMFVISIPMIALAHGYGPLVFGRLLQGVSAGLNRRRRSALSGGVSDRIEPRQRHRNLPVAADAGNCDCGAGRRLLQFPRRLKWRRLGDAARLALPSKTTAWRGIFWVSLPPGILFVIGSFMVAESPRWLLRRGKKDAAVCCAPSLANDRAGRSRTQGNAGSDRSPKQAKVSAGTKAKDSLLRRKYVIPFVLACIILACNQATGINSIIAYNTNILLQSGLSDVAAHWGYVIFTIVNFAVTFGGVMLVDRKGRKFLLGLGTAGIIVSLICTGVLFPRDREASASMPRSAVQSMVAPDQSSTLLYNEELAAKLLSSSGGQPQKPDGQLRWS